MTEFTLDNKLSGDMYQVYSNERPTTKQIFVVIPPMIVYIQNMINASFLRRVIMYCLNIYDRYKAALIVISIAIKGFSDKEYKKANFTQKGTSSLHWPDGLTSLDQQGQTL
ncbi:unnamed protein product [Rhizopus stolonifer]